MIMNEQKTDSVNHPKHYTWLALLSIYLEQVIRKMQALLIQKSKLRT